MRRLAAPFRLLRHAVLLAAAGLFVLPFVWMVLVSLKPGPEIFAADWRFLPQQMAAGENYARALNSVPLLRFLLNGVIVCGATFALQVLVNLPCAYALARLRMRGATVAFGVVLVGLLIPHHVAAIPVYILLSKAGLLNSYAALVLPFVGSVFGIFLLRQHFRSVPGELLDAARLDGLSELAILRRIMVPAAVPAISAFFIFSFVTHWNDYFWPLLVVTSHDYATPPLGLAFFRSESSGLIQFGPLMAAAVVVTAPVLAVFLFAQRRFVAGMTFAGMKG